MTDPWAAWREDAAQVAALGIEADDEVGHYFVNDDGEVVASHMDHDLAFRIERLARAVAALLPCVEAVEQFQAAREVDPYTAGGVWEPVETSVAAARAVAEGGAGKETGC